VLDGHWIDRAEVTYLEAWRRCLTSLARRWCHSHTLIPSAPRPNAPSPATMARERVRSIAAWLQRR